MEETSLLANLTWSSQYREVNRFIDSSHFEISSSAFSRSTELWIEGEWWSNDKGRQVCVCVCVGSFDQII